MPSATIHSHCRTRAGGEGVDLSKIKLLRKGLVDWGKSFFQILPGRLTVGQRPLEP